MPFEWPDENDLRSRLHALAGRTAAPELHGNILPWQGVTYRFAAMQFADRVNFTNGEGARRAGGRFTPIGGPRTVYLSLDRATATAELDSWYEFYSIPATAFQPRVLAAVSVGVEGILDLSSGELLAGLGLSGEHLAEEWRIQNDSGAAASTQAFGQIAFEAGFEGLLAASVRRPGGYNLALFPDNFTDSSHSVMLDGTGT